MKLAIVVAVAMAALSVSAALSGYGPEPAPGQACTSPHETFETHNGAVLRCAQRGSQATWVKVGQARPSQNTLWLVLVSSLAAIGLGSAAIVAGRRAQVRRLDQM